LHPPVPSSARPWLPVCRTRGVPQKPRPSAGGLGGDGAAAPYHRTAPRGVCPPRPTTSTLEGFQHIPRSIPHRRRMQADATVRGSPGGLIRSASCDRISAFCWTVCCKLVLRFQNQLASIRRNICCSLECGRRWMFKINLCGLFLKNVIVVMLTPFLQTLIFRQLINFPQEGRRQGHGEGGPQGSPLGNGVGDAPGPLTRYTSSGWDCGAEGPGTGGTPTPRIPHPADLRGQRTPSPRCLAFFMPASGSSNRCATERNLHCNQKHMEEWGRI